MVTPWKDSSLGFIQQGAEKTVLKILKKPLIDTSHDLHGLNKNECYNILPDIINNSWDLKHRCILIIHGIGQGVLKNIICKYCYEHPLLLACVRAPEKLGGDGATILIFKRRLDP